MLVFCTVSTIPITVKFNTFCWLSSVNSVLSDKIEILDFAETKGKSNARLIEVKDLPYSTIHKVYKSVLISGEQLTIESAVDVLDFQCKK